MYELQEQIHTLESSHGVNERGATKEGLAGKARFRAGYAANTHMRCCAARPYLACECSFYRDCF